MKIRITLATIFILPALFASTPEPIDKVELNGKEYPVFALFRDVKPTRVSNPVYPIRAKKEGRGGQTLVAAIVGEKGKVTATFVAQSNGEPDIQQASRDAVGKWRFPILNDGDKPISYVVFVPVVMNPQ